MNSKSRDSWSLDLVWIRFRVKLSVFCYKCSKRGDSNLFHGNVLVSLCNITPPVFKHRCASKRQLETGGRGGRGEGGEGAMTLRLMIIVWLQVKRVSVTPPAIHRHYHFHYKVS